MESSPADRRPASEVYWAKIVAIPRDWLELLTRPLDFSPGTGSSIDGPEPKYRIIVGRHGHTNGVGVETAADRKSADEALAKVEALLGASTVDDFTGLYELG